MNINNNDNNMIKIEDKKKKNISKKEINNKFNVMFVINY